MAGCILKKKEKTPPLGSSRVATIGAASGRRNKLALVCNERLTWDSVYNAIRAIQSPNHIKHSLQTSARKVKEGQRPGNNYHSAGAERWQLK
jgi:hypothetical protein